jgi:hypothetical protein
MQKFEESDYRDLAEALRERVAARAPGWTAGPTTIRAPS